MTLRRPDQDAIVTAADLATIRQLLVTCSDVLIWAGLHAGTDYHYAVMDITAAAGHRDYRRRAGQRRQPRDRLPRLHRAGQEHASDRRRPGAAAARCRAGPAAAPDAAAAHAGASRPKCIATAKAQRWDPAEVLRALLAEEVAGRDRSSLATRRARAAFPTGKTFERLGRAPVLGPRPHPGRRCAPWNGSPGTRTSSSAARPAPARRSCSRPSARPPSNNGKHVAWFTLEQLGVLVRAHRADDSVTKAIGRILRADLVVVDDIGLLPVGPDAAEGLYRLVDAAYEKTQRGRELESSPSGFDELMPKTLATATVDRLMHHAHLCQTSGDSIRLTQALAGKGVIPLN